MATSFVSKLQHDVTVLPSTFITDYMPYADGDCIKVYLYLLYTQNTQTFSLKKMEEALSLDRKKSCYALHYWQTHGLISMTMDDANEKLVSLCLLPVKPSSFHTMISDDEEELIAPSSTDAENEKTQIVEAPAKKQPEKKEMPKKNIPPKAPATLLDPPQLLTVTNDFSFRALLFTLQQPDLFSDTFLPKEADIVARVYLKLNKNEDLVLYLAKYCIDHYGNGALKKRKLILTKLNELTDVICEVFAKEPDYSIEQVKHYLTTEYSKRYMKDKIYTEDDVEFSKHVLNLLCPGVASANQAELNSLHYWRDQFDINSDILILKACETTRNKAINKLSAGESFDNFSYMFGILKDWQKKGIHTLEEVEADEKKFFEEKKKLAQSEVLSSNAKPKVVKKTIVDYNDFHQHNYNYDEVEDELFEKILKEVKS